ncbi:uncharacterized protein V1518DRAFT_409134 [Limtongia smithiae]|uniref:uncharacterized protein n=1 Tax=Limtongia smithiae TaxID=1125753 RepID=UPI0034CE3CFF
MIVPIITRTSPRAAVRSIATRETIFSRGFKSSQIAKAGGHHYPEGPYNNLPFKVHNRKIPFVIPFSLFFIIPFLTPFGMTWLALSKM